MLWLKKPSDEMAIPRRDSGSRRRAAHGTRVATSRRGGRPRCSGAPACRGCGLRRTPRPDVEGRSRIPPPVSSARRGRVRRPGNPFSSPAHEAGGSGTPPVAEEHRDERGGREGWRPSPRAWLGAAGRPATPDQPAGRSPAGDRRDLSAAISPPSVSARRPPTPRAVDGDQGPPSPRRPNAPSDSGTAGERAPEVPRPNGPSRTPPIPAGLDHQEQGPIRTKKPQRRMVTPSRR